LQRGLADAQDALDVRRREFLGSKVGDEGFQPQRLGRLGNARLAEEIDPVAARCPDAATAARLAAMRLVIVEQDVGERDRLGRRVLRPVLLKIAL